jgi:hypothetical protein
VYQPGSHYEDLSIPASAKDILTRLADLEPGWVSIRRPMRTSPEHSKSFSVTTMT